MGNAPFPTKVTLVTANDERPKHIETGARVSAEELKKLLARKRRGALPSLAQHVAIRGALHKKYGIENYYFGSKSIGNSLSKSLSAVCLVDKKLSKRELNQRQVRCLPKTIGFKADEKARRIKTDVQELGKAFTVATASINPGDNVLGKNSGVQGTIGLFGRHPQYGVVCTTAGHVVSNIMAEGNRASDLLLYDRTEKVRIACTAKDLPRTPNPMRADIDYAILRPRQQSNTKWVELLDHNIVEPYYQPKRSDLSRSLWLIARGGADHTRLLGVKRDAFTLEGRRYSNVILTEPIGRSGDSGGALVDNQYRVWGTLIGTASGAFSMFMSITTLLDNEHFVFGLEEN